MKTGFLLVLAVIALVGFVYVGGQAFESYSPSAKRPVAPSPSPPVSPSTPAPTTPSIPEAPEPELTLVKSWSGTGIKTTEPFTIRKQPWIINWTNKPQKMEGQSIGILQIMVYRSDQPDIPITLAANTQADEVDTSYVYETGTFYLTMNAANTSWEVNVFEER